MARKKRVLFLCTGNSCRSQMAEAIARARHGDRWDVYSAGTAPVGYVHPLALRVLEEIGIHHQGRAKHVDEFQSMDFDLVVTVCDEANESCPVWLGKGRKIHRGFPDPAKVTGSEEEVLAVFRQVRDAIAAMVDEVLRGKAP